MQISTVKIPTNNTNLFLRISKGHFSTGHSHTNYYIDMTTQKSRLSEAKAVAEALVSHYRLNSIVDTVLCLDGTEVIGTCIADELTREDFTNMNAHQTVYIVTPEFNDNQILFRENKVQMINNKHVLILAASVTTGRTVAGAVEAVKYYGGVVAGISSIFATKTECEGIPITAIFNPNDLSDYASYEATECPMCKNGVKLDALVNSHGYSKLN
jgi:orotate phosphoribosyltransferase